MRSAPRAFFVASMTVLLALASGCQHLRWPWWGERTESRASTVDELVVTAPDEGTLPPLPQYWVRNTLVLDLQSVAGTGRARIAPKPGAAWPARLAFRVRPGAFGALEVRGEQRVVLPIAPEGGEVRDLELAPGIYTPSTQALEIGWSPHMATAQSSGG
jgi:hypothetical protein